MQTKLETPVDYRPLQNVVARRRICTYILDIDGTLTVPGTRDPYSPEVEHDLPNEPVVNVIRYLGLFNTLVVVTGRHEGIRQATAAWLNRQRILWHNLFMRGDDDYREDAIVKREIYHEHIEGKYMNVLGVFDDRLSVIDMWQSLGLFVFNCNNGRGVF